MEFQRLRPICVPMVSKRKRFWPKARSIAVNTPDHFDGSPTSRSGFGSFRPCSVSVPGLDHSMETMGCYRLFIWNDRNCRLPRQVLARRSKFPYHICIIHRNGYWRHLQVPSGKSNQPGDSLAQLRGAAYLARLGKPQKRRLALLFATRRWYCSTGR